MGRLFALVGLWTVALGAAADVVRRSVEHRVRSRRRTLAGSGRRVGPTARRRAPSVGEIAGRLRIGPRFAWSSDPTRRRRFLPPSARARRRDQQAFLAVLDGLGSALRSGASPQQAVREVAAHPGAVDSGLHTVVSALDRGTPLGTALHRWGVEQRSPERTLVVAALGTGLSTGGVLARAVDRAATTIRERIAVEREAKAMAAQATTSAAVVAAAPLAFGVLVVLAEPSMASFLFGTPIGWLCLAVGLGLDLIGALWMTVLVRRVA